MREAILSGWITTGPRTKKLEGLISEYVGTDKTVCLNSATAALEMVLHLLDIRNGKRFAWIPPCLSLIKC